MAAARATGPLAASIFDAVITPSGDRLSMVGADNE